jgi:hypothetical protein
VDELDDPGLRVRCRGPAAPSRTLAERLLAVCDLHDFAVALVRARARRAHPGAPDVEIEAVVRAWLAAGPLPEGKPLRWPRP